VFNGILGRMPMPPPGVHVPLLTLYDDDENIDVAATAAFGRLLVDTGVHGLVLAGSTGEFHLHTPAERQALLEAVIAACPGTPVLTQVGAPAQRDAVALAAHAAASDAAAVMLITPYYNRVGPSELAGLARAVHGAAAGLPLIAYTMPAMAGSQWPLDVLRELAEEGVVSGVKESGEEVGRFLQILDRCPPGFAAYCGTPTLLSLVTLAGGAGGILAIANVAPERCLAVYEAAAAGEGRRAAELFAPLVPLLGAIRAAGPSPTGMRAAAAIRWGIGTATRRPLAPVPDDAGIRAALPTGV
jgi:dihydrodipicolinate synthase/N-acetylneuraminate lyase